MGSLVIQPAESDNLIDGSDGDSEDSTSTSTMRKCPCGTDYLMPLYGHLAYRGSTISLFYFLIILTMFLFRIIFS